MQVALEFRRDFLFKYENMIHQTSFGRLFTSKFPLPVEVPGDMDDAVSLLIETGLPNTGADEPPKTGAPLPVEVPGDMDDAVSLLIEAGPPNTGADEPPKTGAPLPANIGEAVVAPPNRAEIKSVFFQGS